MKSRAKSRPKLVAQQAVECEDKRETVFKHYDNKFFDMDCGAEGPQPCAIPVPEIQELQQYVTNCYDALYKDFNAFKSSVTNQILSLQEEVQTLSFHNNGGNDDVFSEAVKESQSQCGYEATEGTSCTFSLANLEEQTKIVNGTAKHEYQTMKSMRSGAHNVQQTPQFHPEMRLHHRPDSTSPAPTDEPSPRQSLMKRPSYQTDDDRIQRTPANVSAKMSESSGRGAFNPTDSKQEATYLSRHLHGSRSPNNTHGLPQSTSHVSKTRPGWSSEKSHELFPACSTTSAWQEEGEGESKEYADAEGEKEEADENIVSEYRSLRSHGVGERENGSSNGTVKGGAGRDRYTLHGWAATFLLQPTDVQLPKGNKQHVKQEILKFNDKERTSKLMASEDTQRGELRTEQSVAEMEISSKRPDLAKGTPSSLSRSNSQDLKLAQAQNTSLGASKPPAAGINHHERRESKDFRQEKAAAGGGQFPGKKCRGGIAWTVDELAEQNKQRAVI